MAMGDQDYRTGFYSGRTLMSNEAFAAPPGWSSNFPPPESRPTSRRWRTVRASLPDLAKLLTGNLPADVYVRFRQIIPADAVLVASSANQPDGFAFGTPGAADYLLLRYEHPSFDPVPEYHAVPVVEVDAVAVNRWGGDTGGVANMLRGGAGNEDVSG